MVLRSMSAERHANDGQQRKSNLEIGIRHHGITVLFEIEPLGIVKTRVIVHPNTLSRIPAEDPPAVPLKMWFVRAGTLRSA